MRKGSFGRLVAKGTRTNGNVYFVKDNNEGNCLLEPVCNQTEDIFMIVRTPSTIVKTNDLEDINWAKIIEEQLNLIEESWIVELVPNPVGKNLIEDQWEFINK